MDGVSFTTEILVNRFNRKQSPDRRLEFTKDQLFPLTAVFYFSKNSTLIQYPFNKLIRLYQESGLITYWTRKYADKFNSKSKFDKRKLTKLDFDNILGAVKIYGALSIISFIVFVMEMLKSRYAIIDRIVEYFTY